MADDEEDDKLDDEDSDEDGKSSASGSKKKLFILIGVALLLVVGGLAAAYFTGTLQPLIDLIAGEEGELVGEEAALPEKAVFYDLEELLVNLNTGGRKSTFLKIRVTLELEKEEDVPRIEMVMPRIIDNFQVYLRELRIEDLKGSAGMYRLREELLMRVGAAAAPTRVQNVLFKEMLVQ
jgi:flagellar FliL protein